MKRFVCAVLVLAAGTCWALPPVVLVRHGDAMQTKAYTVTDTAVLLTTAWTGSAATQFADANGFADLLLVTVESNAVRIACGGGTPTQSGSPKVGHEITAGDALWLSGHKTINSCKVINSVSGSAGVIQITPFRQ